MKIGFIIFEDITILDFIGIYEPVYRLHTMNILQDIEIDFLSNTKNVIDFSGRIPLVPAKVGVSLKDYDVIIVPGGYGTRKWMKDENFIKWLQTMRDDCLKVSVCTGALLLGAAGYLEGRTATTHPKQLALLYPYCKNVVEERVIEDKGVITGGGVTAGIDVGLYVCEKLAGKHARERIQEQMDYK